MYGFYVINTIIENEEDDDLYEDEDEEREWCD